MSTLRDFDEIDLDNTHCVIDNRFRLVRFLGDGLQSKVYLAEAVDGKQITSVSDVGLSD